MKLTDFKNSPISIISFIALTFLFSYLIIGNLEIAGVATILSTWIFMMPRLTHENSMYKNKLPQFLLKRDLINKLINWLIPLIFWLVYAITMQNATLFENPLFGMLFVIMPIVPAGVQYFVLTHSDSPVDWVSAFVTAILTFFGAEFINVSLGTTFSTMFPFFFDGQIIITQLWSIFLEILIIYAFYRIISIIIPSRTLASAMTTFTWVAIAMIQKLYLANIGMSFKFSDIFQIKQFIATLKILFLNNGIPGALLVQGIGITVAISMVLLILNKWTTIYDFKERTKGFAIGIAVFAVAVFAFGFTNKYATDHELEIYKSTGTQLVTEFNQKNEFPDGFKMQVEREMIALGWETKPEETVPENTESTTPPETTEPSISENPEATTEQ